MKICARCGHPLGDSFEISRSSSCPACRADLRTCTNCDFFSPGSNMDCREIVPELVTDKEKGNFCDFFRFKTGEKKPAGTRKAKTAHDDFSKLFGRE
ncbi:MAG: hypothetical protein EHM28_00115 [Spirochaetaceae bacterium]|nr:MAG: hypothetical protein EHM28_00115 [Spirochaetaceae bacterium]